MLPKILPIKNGIKNIALLGGAFNPITKGHVQIGEFLLKNLGNLSEIWIMPCFSHIFNKKLISPEHRLNMCHLALEDHENFHLFNYEIKQKFTGGTYHLLTRLLEEDYIKNNYKIYMVIGMDNANTFHYWLEYKKLQNLIPFIIIPRKGIERNTEITWYKQEPHVFLETQENIMEVSSTQVRSLLSEKNTLEITELIHPKVYEYILENKLYQN